ncbi:MAG TPA: hypothetical protein DD729_07015 [Rhodobacteraceae bacterium]|jgi:pyruvate dehydrogenase complex dehydrogenase (E1) component|nr:hypothetical protein [Paracoccaceae bacterium]
MRRTQKTYDLVTVIDTDDLRVQKFVADSDRLVLCFSGIGRDENQAPVNEFIVNAINDSKDSVLFIVDKNRTWLNGPGLLAEIFKSVDVFFKSMAQEIYIVWATVWAGFRP